MHPNSFHWSLTHNVRYVDLLKFSTVSNALYKCTRGFLCLKKLTFAFFRLVFFLVRFVAKRYILTAKMSEWTDRNLPVRNTPIQRLAIDHRPREPQCCSTALQIDRLTDRRVEGMMMPTAASYCVYTIAVRSAKTELFWSPDVRKGYSLQLYSVLTTTQ